MARDLHDSTGQTLTALKMGLAVLEHKLKQNQYTPDMMSEISALVDQALQEIRTTSYLLHPPLLDEVGFVCAAEWYIEGFAKRSGITIKAEIASSHERLPRKMESALFRVLQECLTNIHRHSGASRASVNFRYGPESVVLEVRDFGKGITQERLRLLSGMSAETGIGLAGMRERLHELKGKLEIESDGNGTRLRATVPLGAAPAPFLIHNKASFDLCPQASR